jgi:hypothetical protein
MEIVRKFGPYLAIEILLPGGSLIAASMFLYRNRKNLLRALSILRPAIRLLSVNP